MNAALRTDWSAERRRWGQEASVEASVLIPALAAAARTRLAAGEMTKVVRSWECFEGSI